MTSTDMNSTAQPDTLLYSPAINERPADTPPHSQEESKENPRRRRDSNDSNDLSEEEKDIMGDVGGQVALMNISPS